MSAAELENIRSEFYQMDKRLALLEQKVDQIDKNIEKIANALGWIVKITGGGLLTAVTAWVLRGGLNG